MITGTANLTYFQGIVENNVDPLGNGRVQIRVFGVHPPYENNQIDTEDLPWAILLNSTYGAIHRVPDIGEWILGISLDGRDHTNLLALGVIPGMQRSAPSGSAHAQNTYAKPHNDMIERIGQPPIPPQMSGEDLTDTPILNHTAFNFAANYKTPDNEGFNEPPIPSNGKPNKTTVWNANYNGSYIEVNDDKHDGYINVVHKSGSGVTIDGNGTIKIKSLGDSWNVSGGNSKEFVSGRKDIIVESGNFTINVVGGDLLINSLGNVAIKSHGNMDFSAANLITLNGGEGVVLMAPKIGIHALADNIEMTAANMTINESGNAIVETTASKLSNVSGDMAAIVGGAVAISSQTFSASGGGNMGFDYGEIHLNSGESVAPVAIDSSIDPITRPEPPIAKTKIGIVLPSSSSGGSGFDIDDNNGETV